MTRVKFSQLLGSLVLLGSMTSAYAQGTVTSLRSLAAALQARPFKLAAVPLSQPIPPAASTANPRQNLQQGFNVHRATGALRELTLHNNRLGRRGKSKSWLTNRSYGRANVLRIENDSTLRGLSCAGQKRSATIAARQKIPLRPYSAAATSPKSPANGITNQQSVHHN